MSSSSLFFPWRGCRYVPSILSVHRCCVAVYHSSPPRRPPVPPTPPQCLSRPLPSYEASFFRAFPPSDNPLDLSSFSTAGTSTAPTPIHRKDFSPSLRSGRTCESISPRSQHPSAYYPNFLPTTEAPLDSLSCHFPPKVGTKPPPQVTLTIYPRLGRLSSPLPPHWRRPDSVSDLHFCQ